MIAETDTLGNVQDWYIYGLGLAYKLMPDGTTYTYHFDDRGSTIAMTDGTGQIVNEYSYGPHGERLGILEGTHNPFGYVGRYGVMEEGNGLKFMRARYYDDATGRFLNKDLMRGSIARPQSLNRYAYGLNNPVNRIDPRGLQEEDPREEEEIEGNDPVAEAEAASLRQDIYKIDPGWEEIRNSDSLDDWNEVEFLRGQLDNLKRDQRNCNDDAARYEQFWRDLTGHAPPRSSPYNIVLTYDENGNIVGATTYDQFGNRVYQYEFGSDVRHGEGYHTYDNSGPSTGFGNGQRSDHYIW